ncbi:lysozyme inhibitor LprI family protein [Serratia sp. NPDC078593]|uniref:lysozyme inhibitor LprI family protein n=1 Tax=unclassified Serratia (in: enterobacteria) TaxID=2647522 RepID=UPI0037D12095
MNKLILFMLFSSSVIAFENCTTGNTNELAKCSYDNYKSEDNLLNYLYENIVTTFPEIKNEVKKTQRLWIKLRDDICAYTPNDGEEYKINKNACLYQQTFERNRELKAIIEKQAELRNSSKITPQLKWNEYIKLHCDFMSKQYSDSGCKDRNQFLHSE